MTGCLLFFKGLNHFNKNSYTQRDHAQAFLKKILVNDVNENIVHYIMNYFDSIAQGFDAVNFADENFLSNRMVFAHIFDRLGIDEDLMFSDQLLHGPSNIAYHQAKLQEIEDYLAAQTIVDGIHDMHLL